MFDICPATSLNNLATLTIAVAYLKGSAVPRLEYGHQLKLLYWKRTCRVCKPLVLRTDVVVLRW